MGSCCVINDARDQKCLKRVNAGCKVIARGSGASFCGEGQAFREVRSWSKRDAPGSTRGAGYRMMLSDTRSNVIGVRDQTQVRPIVRQGGTQVEAEKTDIFPCFATSAVVKDDKSTTGSDRVGKEIVGSAVNAVVCGYGGEVSVRMILEEVEDELCLIWDGEELGPVVDREGGMSRCEEAEKMSFESLNAASRGVRTFWSGAMRWWTMC